MSPLRWCLPLLCAACGGPKAPTSQPAPLTAEPPDPGAPEAAPEALPDPAQDDRHELIIQLAQGALPPAVIDDHLCQPGPAAGPRAILMICVGPGGPGLLRALRAAPGVIHAEPNARRGPRAAP